MKNTFTKHALLILVTALSIICVSANKHSTLLIDEIRMCVAEEEIASCPVDNPVFDKAAENIFISVKTAQGFAGHEMRFTWYKIDDSELFSEFLGTVYAEIPNASGSHTVVSNFPKDVTVVPGAYEVIVHPPGNGKPIIKNFKVLD